MPSSMRVDGLCRITMSGHQKTPIYVQFAAAGVSGMIASVFVHPLDLLKNQIQIRSNVATASQAATIFRTSGVRGLYTGLSAGLLRQATYGSFRMGTYLSLTDNHLGKYDTQPAIYTRVAYGCVAGVAGAIVGTPAEVVLVRMTANLQNNYSNAITALYQISKEEGLHALWRGFTSTMYRAVVANAAELTAYSQAKHCLVTTGVFSDNLVTHVASSIVAAFTNVSVSLPIDLAKTRIQNMKANKREYRGTLHVLQKVVKFEGISALWKGFVPSFACIGPRTVLMFCFFENLCKFYNTYILKHQNNGSGL